MTETEITTRTERTATAEPEPSLTLTQLHSLLRDSAALARAERPIIIAPSTAPAVTVLPTDPGHRAAHPGIDVTVPGGRHPSAAEAQYAIPWAPLRHPVSVRAWGATLAYLGVGSLLAGAADGIVAGDSTLSVGACVGGLAAIVAGIIRAQFEDGV